MKQRVYIGVYNGAEFKHGIYFVLRPFNHCVLALISVRGMFNLSNNGVLNFRKYTPLVHI